METTKTINFQDITKLPLQTHVYTNRAGGFVHVHTPHKGKVTLDLQYDGMFAVHDVLANDTIRALRELEYDARAFLFEEWLKANPTP